MQTLEVLIPADGSRLVRTNSEAMLIGQPPEVLKGLLLHDVRTFDTLVLTDRKERDGSLLNNLEFPLYYFLFMGEGLRNGKRLNLVGDAEDIKRVLRLLRLTLLGPSEDELVAWQVPGAIRSEWLATARHLALKDAHGEIRGVESFFNVIAFEDGGAQAGAFRIRHVASDRYVVQAGDSVVDIDLNDDVVIAPPYPVQQDFIPRELVKLGLEILGSASGFTANEPCTGLALCYNGDYILVDSIPYLDKHLFARGISKNQVAAVFLTHLHDDHCALFPLILMPRKVQIITTRAIYNMAMEKLSCHLDWKCDVIEGYFEFIEVVPGTPINYYGLEILPHVTVHSIPTIGATFSTAHKGLQRRICVIGDNHGMGAIRTMVEEGVVSRATYETLERIYTERFDLLVADGGAGAIHGDPADALRSDAERVVFVHVEHLSNRFNTTFSLASSGKRYTVLDGDAGIYTSLMNHYLSVWLGEPLSNRWARSILAEEEIRRYNAGDVIMVQETRTRGYVFLILTGYCEVVTSDGAALHAVAQLQAGEIIGEMAVVTGSRKRNASVVASSPVTLCVFSEETFNAFITSEGLRDKLLTRWDIRRELKALPQFAQLISTVLEKLAHRAQLDVVATGATYAMTDDYWYLVVSGSGDADGQPLVPGDEFGCRPFTTAKFSLLHATRACKVVKLRWDDVETFLADIPQFSYLLRRYRAETPNFRADWLRGAVPIW
jgi:CRP-like cAMP-binding protein